MRVADEDQHADLLLAGLLARVAEHLADLGVAAAAGDAGHQVAERARVAYPAARAALVEAAEIDELHVEAADLGGLLEHLGLQA